MSEVTELLQRIEGGDSAGYEELIPIIYQQLRALAQSRMNDERGDHTLDATALVNEAFLRLVQNPAGHKWDNSVHFFSAAAEAMRRVLIDHARKKNAQKRGGDVNREDLAVEELIKFSGEFDFDTEDLLQLDQAIQALQEEDPQAAQIVKLRFFAGLKRAEIAKQLSVSQRTVSLRWSYARAWLKRFIADESE